MTTRRDCLVSLGSAACMLAPSFSGANPAKKPTPTSNADLRFILCFLGHWKSFDAADALVNSFGHGFERDREFSELEADDRMSRAFRASADRVEPSMKQSDWRAIDAHTAVLYLLSKRFPREGALTQARLAASLMKRMLIEGGATAIKIETAGLAHGLAHWRTLLTRIETNTLTHADLIRAFVRRPIGDHDLAYSCGAQMLGVRDIEVTAIDSMSAAALLMDQLILKQITAGYDAVPPDRVAVGSPAKTRLIAQTHTQHYKPGHNYSTPYGYLRLAMT